jgi:hypothetical protein
MIILEINHENTKVRKHEKNLLTLRENPNIQITNKFKISITQTSNNVRFNADNILKKGVTIGLCC